MGLDMYLYRRHYVKNWDHYTPEKRFEISVKRGGVPYKQFDASKCNFISEEIAYWRKANAIHFWFVNNVQGGRDDCGEYDLDNEKIATLVELCQKVLDNRDLAPKLLPTRSGFFFGSTEYDDYYFEDLQNTINMLTPYINDEAFSVSYLYHSSW
jgi:hypothetical protein